MPIKLYLDDIKKCDLNLLYNIPKSLRILENFRLNSEIRQEDLNLIRALVFDAYKSKIISSDTKSNAKKFLEQINQFIEKEKYRTHEKKTAIRKQSYHMENLLKDYRNFLRKKSMELTHLENDFYYYLPDDWKMDIDEFSKEIYHNITEMQKLRMNEKEKHIFYKILGITYGANITQLAKHFNVDYNYLWRFIEKFDRLCLIETVGGRRTKKRDRIVFPSLGSAENRQMRDGKEGIITGLLQQNINSYLDWSKIQERFISVYEFNSTIKKSVFVITRHCNLDKYRNRIIRSLGMFYRGNLDSHLWEKYRVKFISRKEEFADNDSLIAYLHQFEGIKETWYDESTQRGRELVGKIGPSPIQFC